VCLDPPGAGPRVTGLPAVGPPAQAGSMITAIHALVYADDLVAPRALFRDVLGWPHVDAHDGWLIFKTAPSELGVHPVGLEYTIGTVSRPRECRGLARSGTASRSGPYGRVRGRSRRHAGRLVADPADLAAQHRVLVPEHQEFGIPWTAPGRFRAAWVEQFRLDRVISRRECRRRRCRHDVPVQLASVRDDGQATAQIG
jgi:catechol 2,3-dioxygenase-like lactoylglutathione lyase family enzyme